MRKNGSYNTITLWSSTIGNLRANQARVRAICQRCSFDQFICLETLEDKMGASFSFWNQRPPCKQPGCDGQVWFQAQLPGSGWPTNMKDGTPHEAEGLHHAWLEGYDYHDWKRREGGVEVDF